MKPRPRRGPNALDVTPPDDLLGPGRTLPDGASPEARDLMTWLDDRGVLARGLPPYPPGVVDPVDDLLMSPILHPGESWEAFAHRIATIPPSTEEHPS